MKHKANELVVGTRYWINENQTMKGIYVGTVDTVHRFTSIEMETGHIIMSGSGRPATVDLTNEWYETAD